MPGQRADRQGRSPISPRSRGAAPDSTRATENNPDATHEGLEPIREQMPSDGRPGSSSDDVPERSLEGDDVEGVRTPVVLKAPHRVTKEEREAQGRPYAV